MVCLFVEMLEFAFKIKGSTKNGRQIKTLLSHKLDEPIPLSNTCAKCSHDVDSKDTIECLLCSEKYHVPCLTVSLSPDTLDAIAANPSLWWFCGACIKNNSSKKSDNSSDTTKENPVNQVDLMNSISKRFSEQFSVLKNEIMNNMETIIEDKFSSIAAEKSDDNISLYSSILSSNSNIVKEVSPPPQAPRSQNFSQVSLSSQLSHAPQLPSPEVLVLSPKNSTCNSLDMNKVKKFVEGKLTTCQTEYIRCYDDTKKVCIGFCNPDLREKAAALINSGNTLDSYGYQSKNSNKMLPKITIHGVSADILDDIDFEGANGEPNKIRDLEKHQIITMICNKNPQIKKHRDSGHTLSVVYLRRGHRKRGGKECEELTIGLKVSPLIHKTIFTHLNATLYLGNRRYPVENRFHIKQCYHCQMIGHISSDCPKATENEAPTCLYCAGEHRSAQCPYKTNKDKHQCARCNASANPNDVAEAKKHNGGSLECPIIRREVNRMAINTDFTSKNVM